jgi:hypothetical protein
MLFSAFSPFGHFRFSSRPTAIEQWYDVLPRLWGTQIDFTQKPSYQEAKLYAVARMLALGSIELDHAGNQRLPDKVYDLLPLQELDYELTPGPNDGVVTRQRALGAAMLVTGGATSTNIVNALKLLLDPPPLAVASFATFVPVTVPMGPIKYVNATGTGVPGAIASPYTASPGDVVVVGTNLGNVVINIPILTAGQTVDITQDSSTTFGANTITVNAPAGIAIARPQPDNGLFTALGGSIVFPYVPSVGPAPPAADYVGFAIKIFNGSASNGAYLLE